MSEIPDSYQPGVLGGSTRDYRAEFTETELERLIDRFFCLYTREPAEEWHHKSEEMLAVIQQAKHAMQLKQQNDRLHGSVRAYREMLQECKALMAEQTAALNRWADTLEGAQ